MAFKIDNGTSLSRESKLELKRILMGLKGSAPKKVGKVVVPARKQLGTNAAPTLGTMAKGK